MFSGFFRTKNAIFSWCPIFCLLFSCWYYIFIHFSHSFPYFPILISSLKWQVVSYAFSPYDFPVYYSYIDFRTKMALFSHMRFIAFSPYDFRSTISMCPIFSKPLPAQASSHVSCSSTPAAGGWSLHLAYQKPAEVVHLLASAQCEA